MTSFAKTYEERKEKLRREVIDHYNNEISKANNNGEHVQVAFDAATDYLRENNSEMLVIKGAIFASAVVGGIVAVATAINAPNHLLSSSLLAAGATLGVATLGGLSKQNKLTEYEQANNLAKALFEKEIVNLQKNKRFSNYTDILFEAASNRDDKDFFKNTMLFSEEFTKKVAEENNFFSKNISVNPYLFKGIDKINKNVNEKIASIKEQVKGKKASI